jgi:hypothetical protein
MILTSALEGIEWSAFAAAALPQGNSPSTHYIETGWDPEPVYTLWKGEKSLGAAQNRIPIHRVPIPWPS